MGVCQLISQVERSADLESLLEMDRRFCQRTMSLSKVAQHTPGHFDISNPLSFLHQ